MDGIYFKIIHKSLYWKHYLYCRFYSHCKWHGFLTRALFSLQYWPCLEEPDAVCWGEWKFFQWSFSCLTEGGGKDSWNCLLPRPSHLQEQIPSFCKWQQKERGNFWRLTETKTEYRGRWRSITTDDPVTHCLTVNLSIVSLSYNLLGFFYHLTIHLFNIYNHIHS